MPFQTVRIERWDDIAKHAQNEWLYRGQRSATWGLKTSLQRSCDRRDVPPADRRAHEDAEPYVPAAWPINAFRLNERLRIQQGAFLIPGDISKPFLENLEALPNHDHRDNVIKIVIPFTERRTALKHLFQMGISRTTLFPGLDGFADSLSIYHPVVDDPINWA